MRYHLCKKSRMYTGFPYQGPTNYNKPAEADTIEEAMELRDMLTKYNPVGWDIYDSTTGELVLDMLVKK